MLELDIQNPNQFLSVPSDKDCEHWAFAALVDREKEARACSVVIRFVDDDEGQTLNHTYRNKDKMTNVLSFPYEAPEFDLQIPELMEEVQHLGDLVLCHSVVIDEAQKQEKTEQEHWAHLIVHGMLHLQGYDHIDDNDAVIMESAEITILKTLGFNNPYE